MLSGCRIEAMMPEFCIFALNLKNNKYDAERSNQGCHRDRHTATQLSNRAIEQGTETL